ALLTFWLLPAFFAVFGPPRRLRAVDVPSVDSWVAVLVRGRVVILPALVVLSLGALYLDRQAYFDFSVLALRDPGSESMQTLRLLNEEGIVTDYSLAVLSTSPKGDESLQRVAKLAVVKDVRNPVDYLPKEQATKLAVLADLSFMLESALDPARTVERPSDEERAAELRDLVAAIEAHPTQDEAYGPRFKRLSGLLAELAERGSGAIRGFEMGVIADLETELDWLRRAVAVRAIDFDDLPDALRARFAQPERALPLPGTPQSGCQQGRKSARIRRASPCAVTPGYRPPRDRVGCRRYCRYGIHAGADACRNRDRADPGSRAAQRP
ncbi:MAG: hypothetical protein HC809_13070, partial [Gammaproteobacteria bacterium]|nr:hypothetical protein [Gammaproteobacteria bacterium]